MKNSTKLTALATLLSIYSAETFASYSSDYSDYSDSEEKHNVGGQSNPDQGMYGELSTLIDHFGKLIWGDLSMCDQNKYQDRLMNPSYRRAKSGAYHESVGRLTKLFKVRQSTDNDKLIFTNFKKIVQCIGVYLEYIAVSNNIRYYLVRNEHTARKMRPKNELNVETLCDQHNRTHKRNTESLPRWQKKLQLIQEEIRELEIENTELLADWANFPQIKTATRILEQSANEKLSESNALRTQVEQKKLEQKQAMKLHTQELAVIQQTVSTVQAQIGKLQAEIQQYETPRESREMAKLRQQSSKINRLLQESRTEECNLANELQQMDLKLTIAKEQLKQLKTTDDVCSDSESSYSDG